MDGESVGGKVPTPGLQGGNPSPPELTRRRSPRVRMLAWPARGGAGGKRHEARTKVMGAAFEPTTVMGAVSEPTAEQVWTLLPSSRWTKRQSILSPLPSPPPSPHLLQRPEQPGLSCQQQPQQHRQLPQPRLQGEAAAAPGLRGGGGGGGQERQRRGLGQASLHMVEEAGRGGGHSVSAWCRTPASIRAKGRHDTRQSPSSTGTISQISAR